MKITSMKLVGQLLLAVLAGSVTAFVFLLGMGMILLFGFGYNHPVSDTTILWTYTLFHLIAMFIIAKRYYQPDRKVPIIIWLIIILLSLLIHILMLGAAIQMPH